MRYAGDPVTLSEKLNTVNKAFIFATDGVDDVEQILRGKPAVLTRLSTRGIGR